MDFEYEVGEPRENAFGEKYYPSANKNLFEKASASTVFGRYFKETFNHENTLYVIGGTDSGLLPFYLAEHFKGERKGRKFIFIDYASLSKETDFSNLPDWVECYPADFPLGILSQSEVEYMASGKTALIKSIAAIDAKYDEPYGQLWAHVEDEYRKLLFAENVTSVTRSFVDAQLLNLHRNIKPVKLLQGMLKGREVLLVGGGPSLDSSIEWIKQNSEKLVIFAAARTSARLLKEGIDPDFLVSVDPHDLSFDNSKQMFLFGDDTVLMNCHHINPKLLNQWANNSVYFGDSLPWVKEENSSSPGPTVIHSALHQAVFMGAKNVYLTGVDLCFYQGKTHASGSAESEIGKLGVKNLTTVETYSGEMAETDQPFANGVSSLAFLVKGYETYAPDCRVYNLSPYAAKVEGVEYRDKETVQLEEQSSKKALMGEINSVLDVDMKALFNHQKASLKVLQKERQQLREAIKLSEEGIKQVAKYQEDPTDSSRLAKSKNKLDKKLGEMGEVLYHYGIESFREAFRPVEDDSQMSEEEIQLTLNAYFKGMKKTCEEFIKQLDKSIDVLKNRMLEYVEDSHPADLLPIWKKQFETGRYLIWKKYHEGVVLSAADEQALEEASDIFEKNISQKDTVQAKLLKDRSISPVELHGKALKAYEKHDLNSLGEIAQQLTQVESFEGKQLVYLVEGMMADLQADVIAAQNAYEQISFKPFKLFSLKRLLNFAMQSEQHEKVLIFLENLCEFSLEYMLPYADYLALLGQNDFAYEVLKTFVKEHPEHFSALLKLAELALKTGRNDEAITSLQQALELEPNNPQVQQMIQLLTANNR